MLVLVRIWALCFPMACGRPSHPGEFWPSARTRAFRRRRTNHRITSPDCGPSTGNVDHGSRPVSSPTLEARLPLQKEEVARWPLVNCSQLEAMNLRSAVPNAGAPPFWYRPASPADSNWSLIPRRKGHPSCGLTRKHLSRFRLRRHRRYGIPFLPRVRGSTRPTRFDGIPSPGECCW